MSARRRASAAVAVSLAALAASIAASACSSSTTTPTPPGDAGTDAPAAEPAWRTVLDGLDGALLGVWGTSEKDVWTVGGSLGNGLDALVLHFDGTTWTREKPGGTETYWWVHGTSASDVWLVGEKGRITHFDGAAFEEKTSGTTDTLYGVQAFSANDAWAVGGIPEQSNVVLHWDGAAWSPETLPAQDKLSFFKVWGTSSDDLWVVGEQGTIWHHAAGAWTKLGAGLTIDRLTTVNGCSAQEIYAVGARTMLGYNGQAWSRIDQQLVNDVNGVACAPAAASTHLSDWGKVVVVGGGSLKLRLAGGTWQDDFGSEPFTDLHATWVDPKGAFWAVGGNFNASASPGAKRNGVIARYADDVVPRTLAP